MSAVGLSCLAKFARRARLNDPALTIWLAGAHSARRHRGSRRNFDNSGLGIFLAVWGRMAIERILKRGFPALAWVLVAVAVYYQARGAAQLLAMKLLSSRPRSSRSDVSLREAQATTAPAPLRALPAPPGALPAPPRLESSDPLSWPICQDVQLLIVTESTDPWWSLTTLREPGEPRPRLRRVGDGVAGKQVAFIGFNPKQQAPAVWLEGRGTSCQSVLFRPQPELATPPQRAAVASSTASFNGARSPVERGLQAPTSLLGPIRVLPEEKQGKVVGLRLFGIRPGSLLSVLGLQNGDRLESINGFSVASPAQALEAYVHLRTAPQLRVQLRRTEAPLVLNLNIN